MSEETKREFLDKHGLKTYHNLISDVIEEQKIVVDNKTITIDENHVISAVGGSGSGYLPEVEEEAETMVFVGGGETKKPSSVILWENPNSKSLGFEETEIVLADDITNYEYVEAFCYYSTSSTMQTSDCARVSFPEDDPEGKTFHLRVANVSDSTTNVRVCWRNIIFYAETPRTCRIGVGCRMTQGLAVAQSGGYMIPVMIVGHGRKNQETSIIKPIVNPGAARVMYESPEEKGTGAGTIILADNDYDYLTLVLQPDGTAGHRISITGVHKGESPHPSFTTNTGNNLKVYKRSIYTSEDGLTITLNMGTTQTQGSASTESDTNMRLIRIIGHKYS